MHYKKNNNKILIIKAKSQATNHTFSDRDKTRLELFEIMPATPRTAVNICHIKEKAPTKLIHNTDPAYPANDQRKTMSSVDAKQTISID